MTAALRFLLVVRRRGPAAPGATLTFSGTQMSFLGAPLAFQTP